MSDHASMRRLWTLASLLHRAASSVGPWHCQLISTQCTGEALALDLVALEDSPFGHIACPAHAPFTVRIERAAGAIDPTWVRALATWSADADVVTISCEVGAETVLMRVTSATHELVLRLDADRPDA